MVFSNSNKIFGQMLLLNGTFDCKSTQNVGGAIPPHPYAEQRVRSLKFLTSPFNIRNFLTLAQILFTYFMQDETSAYNLIQYLWLITPLISISFSKTPPLFIMLLAEPTLLLSQVISTLSMPSFLHSSSARAIIWVA